MKELLMNELLEVAEPWKYLLYADETHNNSLIIPNCYYTTWHCLDIKNFVVVFSTFLRKN